MYRAKLITKFGIFIPVTGIWKDSMTNLKGVVTENEKMTALPNGAEQSNAGKIQNLMHSKCRLTTIQKRSRDNENEETKSTVIHSGGGNALFMHTGAFLL